jgi:exopolyphosphatase/guanosine-5'-triphosphate,3'-diphosphate pyrophosphatase
VAKALVPQPAAVSMADSTPPMDPAPWRAVIDIGTNTVLMLIARRGPDRRVEVKDDVARIARLGEGAAARGTLAPEAISRTLAVLAEHRARAAAEGAAITAVATAGVRMASNRDDFLVPAAAVLGVPVRVIDGDEEAELSFRSVVADEPGSAPPSLSAPGGDGRPARDDAPHVRRAVLDIGGGSTELVIGTAAQIERRVSLAIGSVRLTEAVAMGDPPGDAGLAELAARATAAFAAVDVPRCSPLVGLAGTVTTAAAVLLGLPAYDRARVDGATFTRAEVVALRDRLAHTTVAARLADPCIGPGRADVFVAGLAILVAALDRVEANSLLVRDRGLRYALV